ncbi:uncharacterized protein LOC143629966 [Bidens hawaiensis]|uniref:uncharacterized protein LOC143629966 n=1 Tax=Bidens hawaiensis TaxID=980011 RepID=UPI00404B32A6
MAYVTKEPELKKIKEVPIVSEFQDVFPDELSGAPPDREIEFRIDLAARDRQKSYADIRRKPLEFKEGDRILLKVSPWKGVVRFGKKGKLSPRFVGPFKILERIGPVAYRLELPDETKGIHDVFHVSDLRKCLADETLAIPLKYVKINEKLKFVEQPIQIEDSMINFLKHK